MDERIIWGIMFAGFIALVIVIHLIITARWKMFE